MCSVHMPQQNSDKNWAQKYALINTYFVFYQGADIRENRSNLPPTEIDTLE